MRDADKARLHIARAQELLGQTDEMAFGDFRVILNKVKAKTSDMTKMLKGGNEPRKLHIPEHFKGELPDSYSMSPEEREEEIKRIDKIRIDKIRREEEIKQQNAEKSRHDTIRAQLQTEKEEYDVSWSVATAKATAGELVALVWEADCNKLEDDIKK